MKDFETEELQIAVDDTAEEISLQWLGRCTARRPEEKLLPYLELVAQRAKAGGKVVVMHFEGLELFNSSTITVLIQFIQKMRQLGVAMRITFDPDYKWQRLSFEALRIFEKPDGLLTLLSC